jgi:hypothetical protein
MRVLLDECLPVRLRRNLPGHDVQTVPQEGWASIKNGKLLRLIAASGKFDVFLTVDKNLPREQKIEGLPFAVVVLRAKSNALPMSFHLRRNYFAVCLSFNPDRFMFFQVVINAASQIEPAPLP